MKNTCPNCGAAMELNECRYCGTMLLNLMDIDMDDRRSLWIKVRHEGNVICMRANVHEVSITARPQYDVMSTIEGRVFNKLIRNEVEVECRFTGEIE